MESRDRSQAKQFTRSLSKLMDADGLSSTWKGHRHLTHPARLAGAVHSGK